jgi:hypothetical protein
MTPSPSVQQHPSSVDAYIRAGWSLVPIPAGTKGPRTQGWNQRDHALRSAGDLPQGFGIGLAHAYSGTMALDIDSWDRAAFELMLRGINLQALYDAPDAVVIDSGRPGHGKLLYAMPKGVVLPSKKIMDTDAEGKAYNYMDFRCGTSTGLTAQDVLPPSIHPDTGQPYRWAGRGHWERLPQIPEGLLTMWHQMLRADEERSIPTGENYPVSWSEIQHALGHISPDCSRQDWIAVGMALQWAGHTSGHPEQALSIWNDWSKGSETKYPGDRAILGQWRSFEASRMNGVKLGTLIHLARQSGWKRPTPDVALMFSPTAGPMIEPSDIRKGLRPSAPEVDMDLFPKVLRDRAQQIGHEIGCDPLVPLFAGLATVAGAIDAQSRLELMPRFQVPPVVWLMTIGNPALKKSPASKPLMRVLSRLEDDDRPRYQKDILDWEAKEVRWASAKKAFLDFAGSPDAMLDAPAPEVPELPPKPVPVKITVQDVTSQKLVRLAAERPRGILCVLDEMNAWVQKMTSRFSGEDRSSWVVSYEADKYEMDRVGAGSIHAENLAVSIYGNIQPEVFHKSMGEMAEDGMLQRFIPAVLRERDWGIGQPLPEERTNIAEWEQTVRLVYALPAQTYKLSPEAHAEYRTFQARYNAAKQDELLLRSGNTFMTAFGKLEGTVGRLALLWHVLECPFSTQVTGDTMARVIRFAWEYIVPVYRYAFGEMVGSRATFDEFLADYVIQRADMPIIKMADVKVAYRNRWEGANPWTQDQWVISAMVLLEHAGWVTRMDDGSQEHKHIAEWAVNPRLKDVFSEHRKSVIAAAQRRAIASLGRIVYQPIPRVHGHDAIDPIDPYEVLKQNRK